MSDWREKSCDKCGDSFNYHIDWDRIPDLCKSCIADKKAERDKWHEKDCSKCSSTIKYHEDWSRIPDLCKPCIQEKKAEALKWHEASCGDCQATIKYHEDWARVPDLCKSCIQERRRKKEEALAKWREKQCDECSTTIKYNIEWEKVSNLCKPCIERKKQEKADRLAQWKEASCKKCSQSISYNINWPRVPDLCRSCIELVKAEKAKWKFKNCTHCSLEFKYNTDWDKIPTHCKLCNQFQSKKCLALSCNEKIQFKIFWENIPEYCSKCKGGERRIREVRKRDDGTKDIYEGKGYINKNGVIVFNDNLSEGKHSHKVVRADGIEVGHREKGHNAEWVDGLWKERNCSQCSTVFKIHIDWEKPPELCGDCRDEVKRKKEEEKSKWIEIVCSNEECSKKFRYHQSWSNAPNLCKECLYKKKQDDLIVKKEKERANADASFTNKSWKFGNTDETDPSKMKVVSNEYRFRVEVISGNEKPHEHIIYEVDKKTGEARERYLGENTNRQAWKGRK